jgi:hypothetical protein
MADEPSPARSEGRFWEVSVMNGSFGFPSSFRKISRKRDAVTPQGVSFPKLAGDNGGSAQERAVAPGCKDRRRKARRDHAIFYLQHVENGALRPSPHLIR